MARPSHPLYIAKEAQNTARHGGSPNGKCSNCGHRFYVHGHRIDRYASAHGAWQELQSGDWRESRYR